MDAVLVLLPPERAGPLWASQDLFHESWILWPTPGVVNHRGRPLSLLTGIDWVGETEDLAFDSNRERTWSARNLASLTDRGYFAARQAALAGQPVTLAIDSAGDTRAVAAFLALDGISPEVRGQIAWQMSFPQPGLTVFAADNWDQVARIARRADERTLVIEYPPEPGLSRSRFWLYGKGWPNPEELPTDPSLAVPGIVLARHTLALLQGSPEIRWDRTPMTHSAVQLWWLKTHDEGRIWFGAFVLALVTVAFAVAFVHVRDERRRVLPRLLLTLVFALPAADVIGAAAVSRGGEVAYPYAAIGSALTLVALAELLRPIGRKRDSPGLPLQALCSISLILMCLPVATWSHWFDPFAADGRFALGLGLITFNLAGVWSNSRPKSLWPILLTLAVGALFAANQVPWIGDARYLITLPVVAMAAAEGIASPLFLAALLAVDFADGIPTGVAWKPFGLIARYSDIHSVAASQFLNPLTTTALPLSAAIVFVAFLADNGFAFHRIGQTMRERWPKACLTAAACLGILSLTHPYLIQSALILLLTTPLTALHQAQETL